MNKITLTIDDKQVEVKAGMTVLEAARKAGIYIPTLCYHSFLAPYGGCRICVIEIEKMRGFPTACTTPAGDGMVGAFAGYDRERLHSFVTRVAQRARFRARRHLGSRQHADARPDNHGRR